MAVSIIEKKKKLKSAVWCSYTWSRKTFPSCMHVLACSRGSVTLLSSNAFLNVMSHGPSQSMYQIRHLVECLAKQNDLFRKFPQRFCWNEAKWLQWLLSGDPQFFPEAFILLGFPSCTFSFGESLWETVSRELSVLEITVLPRVAKVTTNPSSLIQIPPEPLTSLQFPLKISSRGYNLPRFKQREIQGSLKSESTLFGTKGICSQEDWSC